MFIKGVNLGNWLVLEKWMNPALFAGTEAADEYYLPRALPRDIYENRIRLHRHEYISERDFATIKSYGFNAVRIPVPYFIFGDCEPFIACIEELDKAFNWASKYQLQVLINLHTVPGSQNGFDNGGISGVCKWAQQPESVEFTLSVLERLAQRYGTQPQLYGIEILNEPLTEIAWETFNITERYPAVDSEMAQGSAPVPIDFLKDFYREAYSRIRKHMPVDKAVVFHDGFDIYAWKNFMQEPEYQNVVLDTHQYLMIAEAEGCAQNREAYVQYIRENYAPKIAEMSKYFPVICGEWSLFNSAACGCDTQGGQSILNGVAGAEKETTTAEEKKELYQAVGQAQIEAWEQGAGYFYWNYKLLLDTVNDKNWIGWDAWDLGKSIAQGWFPPVK